MSKEHRHNGESVLGCPECDPVGSYIEERRTALASAESGDEGLEPYVCGCVRSPDGRWLARCSLHPRAAAQPEPAELEAEYDRGWRDGNAAADEAIRLHSEGPGHHYSLDDCRAALAAAQPEPEPELALPYALFPLMDEAITVACSRALSELTTGKVKAGPEYQQRRLDIYREEFASRGLALATSPQPTGERENRHEA